MRHAFCHTIGFLFTLSCITICCTSKSNTDKTSASVSTKQTSGETETGTSTEEFVGQYLDLENSEPNLHIYRKDGHYAIQIGIFRLTQIDDGKGLLSPEGLEFTATDAAGNPIDGIITLSHDTAIVTFTSSTWSYIQNGDSFKYIKEIGAESVINRICEIYDIVAQDNFNDFVLAKEYCSADWNKIADAVIESDNKHPDNIGFFDFSFWIMAQDMQEISISDISVNNLNSDKPFVMFNLHNLGTTKLMRLEIVKEGNEWKIDNFNILGAETLNMKEQMLKYLKNEEHTD